MAERARELRLFVACELSDEVRQALGRVQHELQSLGADRLRWVRPEAIHITLKFLGNVAESRVPAINEALGAAVEPFTLRLQPSGIGTFPSPLGRGARLRVVWVGLEGDVRALSALAGRVESALGRLGFERERRPFAPHLTLARARDRMSGPEVRRAVEAIEGYRCPALPSLEVREVRLMRSDLGPGGAVYQELGRFPEAT